jgi:hypothetical protein
MAVPLLSLGPTGKAPGGSPRSGLSTYFTRHSTCSTLSAMRSAIDTLAVSAPAAALASSSATWRQFKFSRRSFGTWRINSRTSASVTRSMTVGIVSGRRRGRDQFRRGNGVRRLFRFPDLFLRAIGYWPLSIPLKHQWSLLKLRVAPFAKLIRPDSPCPKFPTVPISDRHFYQCFRGPPLQSRDVPHTYRVPEGRVSGYGHRIWSDRHRHCGRNHPGNYGPWHQAQNHVLGNLNGAQVGRLSWWPLSFLGFHHFKNAKGVAANLAPL